MFKHGMNEFDTECRHGTWVASHPVATILASVAVCGVFALGLINFHQETNMVRLWLPQVKEQIETSFYVCMQDSDFVQHMAWLWQQGPTDAGYRWRCLKAC